MKLRVTCRSNSQQEIANLTAHPMNPCESEHSITPGKSYAIAGMCILEDDLQFLIEDDDGLPRYEHAAFFEDIVDSIPSDWKFRLGRSSAPRVRDSRERYYVVGVWGYPEMIDDVNHDFKLIGEGDVEVVKRFRQYVRGD